MTRCWPTHPEWPVSEPFSLALPPLDTARESFNELSSLNRKLLSLFVWRWSRDKGLGVGGKDLGTELQHKQPGVGRGWGCLLISRRCASVCWRPLSPPPSHRGNKAAPIAATSNSRATHCNGSLLGCQGHTNGVRFFLCDCPRSTLLEQRRLARDCFLLSLLLVSFFFFCPYCFVRGIIQIIIYWRKLEESFRCTELGAKIMW